MTPSRLIACATFALTALLTLPAQSQTSVNDAWVRGTVAEQKATGAFMQLTSVGGGKLVSISSPAAGVVEIHEMKMTGNTMQMRTVRGLDLPAGKPVELKPGGYHVMLLDLKAPLAAGSTVDLTLVVEGKDGQRETVLVKAPVRALGAAMPEHKH
jgi:copper(I)-binding protein